MPKKPRALEPHVGFNVSTFPFTLNPTVGCFYGCKYCYLQVPPYSYNIVPNQVSIKDWLPNVLETELNSKKYKNLPQYFKRVQINESCDSYHPAIMNKHDIMKEILLIFKKHPDWMLHILTKSNKIIDHIDLLTEMKHQVQIEITITTLDEEKARMLEGTAPKVSKRLHTLTRLVNADIFTRVMCMPFTGNNDELKQMKSIILDMGVKGFKHKSLNYFDEEKLNNGIVEQVKNRHDKTLCLFNSGEKLSKETKILLPLTKAFSKFKDHITKFENWGYSYVNNLNWEYIL
jgi:DNA repair photolyase